MVERASRDPDEGVKRFLEDLRAGPDRRSWGERRKDARRMDTVPVDTNRRLESDRRLVGQRRGYGDRRRQSVAQFSWEQCEVIRQMMAHPGRGVACPRCSGSLLMGPRETHAEVNMQEVHCTGCRHSVVLVDPPAS